MLDNFAGVLVAHHVPDLGLAFHRVAVELDDGVSLFEARLMRRRAVTDAIDDGLALVDIVALHGDPHQPGEQVFAPP